MASKTEGGGITQGFAGFMTSSVFRVTVVKACRLARFLPGRPDGINLGDLARAQGSETFV